jgi:hypothetical protein
LRQVVLFLPLGLICRQLKNSTLTAVISGISAGSRLFGEESAPAWTVGRAFHEGTSMQLLEFSHFPATGLPPPVVVSGERAADGDRFQRPWVRAGRRPRAGCVSAAVLYGTGLKLGHGSKGGWDAFGVERKLTRSAGDVPVRQAGFCSYGEHSPYRSIYREIHNQTMTLIALTVA